MDYISKTTRKESVHPLRQGLNTNRVLRGLNIISQDAREKSAVREVVVTGVWPKLTRTGLTFSTERRPLIALLSLSFFSPQPSTRLRDR